MVQIEYEDNIAYVNMPKTSTVMDYIKAMGLLFSNPDYRQNPVSLWKLHETEMNVSPTDLKTIKDYVMGNRGGIPEGKAAVIVKSQQQKGIMLIYELISYQLPVEMKIFEDYETGLNWLKSKLHQ